MSAARVRAVRAHAPHAFHGRVDLLEVESAALAGNALGDPHVRELPVYAPPPAASGATPPDEELPLFVVLPGFTGNGRGWFDTHPWWPGWIHAFDAAVRRGEAPRVRIAVPDCITRWGGSQYVDSPAVGAYETHVVDELVPLALEHAPGSRGRVALIGKSSGGFGALRLALRHPGHFQACASISGDCAFDQHYPHEFLNALRGLVTAEQSPAEFLAAFAERPNLAGDGHAVIYVLACAACYSPRDGAPSSAGLPFDLPFDLTTGELVPAVWERWLAFDPLNLVDAHAEALRGLRRLWIECGVRDEFHLQWGARRLSRLLEEAGVPHEHVEHPGGHRGIDARYGAVLSALAPSLA